MDLNIDNYDLKDLINLFKISYNFNEDELSSLPESRQKSYDYERSSTIYLRNLWVNIDYSAL